MPLPTRRHHGQHCEATRMSPQNGSGNRKWNAKFKLGLALDRKLLAMQFPTATAHIFEYARLKNGPHPATRNVGNGTGMETGSGE